MLDWFSGCIGYDGSQLCTGTVVRFDRFGAIVGGYDTWESVNGSWSDTVQVRPGSASNGMLEAARKYGFVCSPICLDVSGNPTKFLQGHNLAGISVSFLGPLLREMVARFDGEFRPGNCADGTLPSVTRRRMDVTVMVDLGDHQTVHDWLTHAEKCTRSRHGRAQRSEGTVYWGKSSRRWALKAYCKGCELKVHPPSVPLDSTVEDWAHRMLRLELVLRGPELKPRGTLDEGVVWEYMRRIEVGVMKEPKEISAKDLPRSVANTFRLWVYGCDMRQELQERTFRRLRRRILDLIGVDISLTPTEEMGKLETAGLSRDLFDVEVLKARESRELPDSLQKSLFTVKDLPGNWGVR